MLVMCVVAEEDSEMGDWVRGEVIFAELSEDFVEK